MQHITIQFQVHLEKKEKKRRIQNMQTIQNKTVCDRVLNTARVSIT